jgi:hypothetical protein
MNTPIARKQQIDQFDCEIDISLFLGKKHVRGQIGGLVEQEERIDGANLA